MENTNFSCSGGASLALNADDAEMLLFAFDADLDTQLDVVPFGSTERQAAESPAPNKTVD